MDGCVLRSLSFLVREMLLKHSAPRLDVEPSGVSTGVLPGTLWMALYSWVALSCETRELP